VKIYDPAKHGLNPLPMDYREAQEFPAAVLPIKISQCIEMAGVRSLAW